MLVPAWKRALQSRVSSLFYRHGLFCASHPYSVIFCVICAVIAICYPLTRLPLPGNPPAEFSTPIAGYKIPPLVVSPDQPESSSNEKDKGKWPKWYRGPPAAYVQQILVKVTVSPWKPYELIPNDAFRAPLARVFDVLAHVDNFQDHSLSLADLCLHVPETIAAQKVPKGLLPEYNCLVLSPAQMWNRDKNRFVSDGEIIRTIYKNYGRNVNTPPSLRDILFGVAWKDTGLKRFYLRNRQRVISYAITIVYEKYDPKFTAGLHRRLRDLYSSGVANDSDSSRLTHVHSESVNYFVEYTPLLVSYVLLFLYIYFSVRKIEMVKSKWGLAFSAVVMVITSLLMSVSICLSFGLTPSLKGSEIFPYLVVIIGLENVLVMTKSVVSTPVHLEVKLRVAQGLSKEGWYIFKNLTTELLILMVGFFTFVPAVQEFCLFAVVGLLSDFFLQNIFFATVLAIDIRRMELSDLHRQKLQPPNSRSNTPHSSIMVQPTTSCQPCPVLTRWLPAATDWSKSAARAEGGGDVCPSQLARRVRLWNFWARTRVAQRAIMVCVVLWIALIVYKSGLVGHFVVGTVPHNYYHNDNLRKSQTAHPFEKLVLRLESRDMWLASDGDETVTEMVAPSVSEPWRKLAHTHWTRLFSFYNISLLGRYITMLPSTHLSLAIRPDDAISLRHPKEAQAAALFSRYVATRPAPHENKADLSTPEGVEKSMDFFRKSVITLARHVLWAPQNRIDTILTLLLGGATLLVLVCFLGTLYRRLCPRDYARRRRQRKQRSTSRITTDDVDSAVYRKQIRDAVPLVLSGHAQEVECIGVDGPVVVSSCLAGEIRIWDSLSGECIRVIKKRRTNTSQRTSQIDNDAPYYDDIVFSDQARYKLSSASSIRISNRRKCVSRSHSTSTPDLVPTIDTHFANIAANSSNSPYDFGERFESRFIEHQTKMAAAAGCGDGGGWDASAMERSDEVMLRRQSHSFSFGDSPPRLPSPPSAAAIVDTITDAASAIWCLCCHSNLVLAGCGGGSIEFWDALTGQLRYCYRGNTVGVTDLCIVDNRVVAARQNGSLDFLELRTYVNSPHYATSPQSPSQSAESQLHNRGHMTRQSDSVIDQTSAPPWDSILNCVVLATVHAHQRPITVLQIAAGHVITGSRDHTLKVFRIEDALPVYTLHGHRGSITALHVDTVAPLSAASGSADGTVRLWNLAAGGACVHRLDGQSDAVTALVTTRHHVVCAALDDCLCVWQRATGRPLHRLQMGSGSCNSLAMLTQSLMISGGRGCLYLWDILRGEVLRVVPLGGADHSYSVFIRQVHVIGHCTVVCDCGTQLRVVHFPSVLEKVE